MASESSAAPTTDPPIPATSTESSTTTAGTAPVPLPPSSAQPQTNNEATSPAPPKRVPSISDPNVRVCFICLLNSNETPNATWVNPCPCTLEAHEECMLKWVAEMESSGGSGGRNAGRGRGGTLRCPACKGTIQVFEPFDPVLWVRDRVHRMYSRASPFVLLGMVGAFGVAGSGYYGIVAMSTFAGSNPTLRWLGVPELIRRREGTAWWRHGPSYAFAGKVWLLHLVAPALMINKAIPGIDSYMLLPVSLLHGMSMAARDNMPQWPPSPEWAMTLMPFVSLAYYRVYYQFFGTFEKQLNNMLRGREADEGHRAQVQQAPQGDNGGQQGQQQRQNGAARGDGDNNVGLGTALYRLAGAVFNLFLGEGEVVNFDDGAEGDANDVRVVAEQQIELDVGLDDNGRIQFELIREQIPPGIEIDEQALQVAAEAALRAANDAGAEEERQDADHHGPQHQGGDGRPQQEQPQEQPAEPAQLPPPRQEPENQPLNQDQNQARNQNRRQRQVDGGTGGPFSSVINGIVSALLFPAVSYGMGELLRLTLPTRMVRKPWHRAPTGLLQEQWGRSLVGGCLYVVMRDAFMLYIKWRRVQTRKNRKVKNVERRANRITASSS